MKREGLQLIQRICVFVGIGLLAAAILTLALWRWNVYDSEKQAERYVSTLQSLIPPPRDAALEERRDNHMAVLSIDGTDFVGILEMPRYQSALPICAEWGKSSKYPCRFSGSVYDGTIQIGATTQKGQYDFYRELALEDHIVYTDMEGNRYTYTVKGMRYEKHVDQKALQREDADLTLFIKNIYSFEYLIVFCEA